MGIVVLIPCALDCHSDLQSLQKFPIIIFVSFPSFISVQMAYVGRKFANVIPSCLYSPFIYVIPHAPVLLNLPF